MTTSEGANLFPHPYYGVVSVHHVGVLCDNLERSLEFYQGILGLFHYLLAWCLYSSPSYPQVFPYTLSRSGRPAIFTKDPDANALRIHSSGWLTYPVFNRVETCNIT
ncbi:hypothetical protein D5086_031798 [Populus alba]|uniref:Uncharacterized protein n=1 Tax=Populus alba TaxID=43335 RepID=A0ACC4AJJ1_POPAL